MAKVSVEKSAVEKSIALCESAIRNYEEAAGYLEKQYRIAGSGWNDDKYKQLGNVVQDCTTALNRPVSELEECLEKLRLMLKAIEQYENENL